MRENKYKLVDKEVIPVPDVIEWAKWFETFDRRVAKSQVKDKTISTVFLGVDYNFGEEGDPLVFETMVFSKEGPLRFLRYSTWEQAVAGHAKVVKEEEDAD